MKPNATARILVISLALVMFAGVMTAEAGPKFAFGGFERALRPPPPPRRPQAFWYTFSSREYGFSIIYPSWYYVRTQTTNLPPTRPQLLAIAAFHDNDRTPDSFLLEIFPIDQRVGLRQWLDRQGLISRGSVVDTIKTQGAQEGWKVRDGNGAALRYFRRGGIVVRLTPQGDYAKEMGDSFQMF